MMNMMANELKEMLSLISLAAGTDRDVETGSTLYFTGETMGLYSGDAFVTKSFRTDFVGGVDILLLENIVDKYGTGEISLSRSENEFIVKRKKSVSKLVVNDNNQFPKIRYEPNSEWRKIPHDFSPLLEMALQLTSNNFNEPAKTTVHINSRKMEASDGFHFGIFRMKGYIPDDLYIRKDFVKILIKFEPVEYRLSDSWICFKNAKDYFLAVRKVDVTDYPVLEEIFSSNRGKTTIELPDKIISSLERAELFLRNEVEFDRFIRLECLEGKITISTETKSGSYRDSLSGPKDVTFNILINPKHLVEMLFHTNCLNVAEQAATCETKTVKLAACLVG